MQTTKVDPTKLFSENASIDKNARIHSIAECTQLCNTMKTILGPKSFDKLLIGFDGDIAVTNDGATALANMKIEHPATKLLVQLSSAMDDEIGDGTTTVVVLAGSLLQQAQMLLERQVHPMAIIRGFAKASQNIQTPLKRLAKKFDPLDEKNRDILVQVAKTTLSSKLVSKTIPDMANMAVSAIIGAKGSEKRVQVVCQSGAAFKDSKILEGNTLIFESKIIPPTLDQIELNKPTIAVLTFPLDKPRTSGHYKIVANTPEQIDRLIKEEESYVKKLIVGLKKIKTDFICVQQSFSGDSISENAKHFLTKAKIFALKPLEKSQIQTICDATGAIPITSADQLLNTKEAAKRTAKIEKIYTEDIGNKSYVIFKADSNAAEPHVSVILRGPSLVAVEESERALHDALRVLESVFISPEVVPGGGACEMAVSAHLRKLAESSKTGTEHLSVLAFAEALEEIPRVLSSNSGMNVLSSMNTLRKEHLKSEICDFGVNAFAGTVSSMKDTGVLELMQNKLAQITMAAQAAEQILKIDTLYTFIKPKQ